MVGDVSCGPLIRDGKYTIEHRMTAKLRGGCSGLKGHQVNLKIDVK